MNIIDVLLFIIGLSLIVFPFINLTNKLLKRIANLERLLQHGVWLAESTVSWLDTNVSTQDSPIFDDLMEWCEKATSAYMDEEKINERLLFG